MRKYFHFSKAERKGILALILGIILTIAFKQSLVYFELEPQANPPLYDSLLAELKRLEQESKSKELATIEGSKTKHLSKFDPNDLNVSDWEELGLSEKQALSIENYRAKFGGFKSKADIRKLYVISKKFYSKIEPFILLPDTVISNSSNNEENKNEYTLLKKAAKPIIDINEADTIELVKLYGIGNVLSKRIVKYRNKLGGFHSLDQLREVYGLKEETIDKVKDQLVLTNVEVMKLNINESDAVELKKHPYINWNIANSIVKYRKQHGKYTELIDLKNLELVNDSVYQKISAYLEI